EVEGLADDAAQAAVVHHVEHGREAAAAAGAAAHQREGAALKHRKVERDLAPRGGAGDDQAAARLEAGAALVPHGGAHAVEDHVDAAPARHLLHLGGELRGGRVVDHVIGAELLGLLELPVAARGDDRAGADALGDRKAKATDSAT